MSSFTEQIDQARDDVRYALCRIEEQKLLIERLLDDAYDTKVAEHVLTTFMELRGTLSVHVVELEREVEGHGTRLQNRDSSMFCSAYLSQ